MAHTASPRAGARARQRASAARVQLRYPDDPHVFNTTRLCARARNRAWYLSSTPSLEISHSPRAGSPCGSTPTDPSLRAEEPSPSMCSKTTTQAPRDARVKHPRTNGHREVASHVEVCDLYSHDTSRAAAAATVQLSLWDRSVAIDHSLRTTLEGAATLSAFRATK